MLNIWQYSFSIYGSISFLTVVFTTCHLCFLNNIRIHHLESELLKNKDSDYPRVLCIYKSV